MDCTSKASVFLRKVSPAILESIPNPVFIIAANEPIPKGIEPKNCICIGEKLSAKEVINIAHATGISQILQASPESLSFELSVAGKMISHPKNFMNNSIDLILGPHKMNRDRKTDQIRVNTWVVRTLSEKEVLKSKIRAYINLIADTQHIEKSLLAIADELFSNGLYHNLPAEADSTIPEQVQLAKGSAVEIFIADENDVLLIGYRDSFGSLAREKLMKPLWASFRGEKIQSINLREGGAGIGCRLMFNYCIGFFVAVNPGVSTFFALTLPLGISNNISLEHSKNFHFTVF